jgi:hypothetical protein
MKTLPIIIALIASPFAFAGFNLPGSIHEAGELSKAADEARAKNKPVAIMVTDKNTTCGICASASLTAVKELKSKTEMVYVKSGETSSLPDPVKVGLNSATGKYLPQIVIVDSSLTNVIAAFGYNDPASFKKSITEAEKKMRAAKTPATPAK